MPGILDQIIKEQMARVRAGQILPRDLSRSIERAYLAQKREEALFRAGLSERPGRNWQLMEESLTKMRKEDPSVIEGFARNFGEIAGGMGSLLWRTITSPLRPEKTARFLTSGFGKLEDPAAWRRAYKKTLGPGEVATGGVAPPSGLGGYLQQAVAQTGRGYADLAKDPIGRFKRDPLYTILDILPLVGATAGLAAKAGLVGRTAAGYSKLAPRAAVGALGRGIERRLPAGSQRAVQAIRDKMRYGELEARNLGEHHFGRKGAERWTSQYEKPWMERFEGQPETLRAIIEGRAMPIGLGGQELRDLQAFLTRRGRRIERHSTRPIQESLGKLTGKRPSGIPTTEYRPYAPAIDIMTGSVFGKKARLADMPEAHLLDLAKRTMPANPVDQITVRNLARDIVREGKTPEVRGVPGLKGKPTRKGNVIEYDPLEPQYVADFAELQGARGQDFMLPSPRAKEGVSMPFGQARAGGQDIPMLQNVADIDSRHFAQVRRAVQNKQFGEDVLANFSREIVLEDGTKLRKIKYHETLKPEIRAQMDAQGLTTWSPAPMLRFYSATIDLPEVLIKRLKKGGADEANINKITSLLSKEITPETINRYMKVMGVKKNDSFYFVPKQIAAELNKRIQARSVFMKFAVDTPLDIWRPLVLGTPRWIVNNVVGNFFLNTLRGVGPVSYARGLASFWREWRKTHGAKAFAAMDEIPEQVKRGMVESELRQSGRHIGDISRGGELAEYVAGGARGMVDAPVVRQVVGGVQKYFQMIQRINMGVEDVFRRANYLRGAYPMARKRIMQRAGENAVTSQAMLDELSVIAKDVAHYDPIVSGIKTGRELMRTGPGVALLNTVNEFLFDYMKMSPFERRYMRSLFPFYSWYKNITRVVLTLPLNYPGRAKMLDMLATAGREANKDIDRKDVPEYMRSSVRGKKFAGIEPFSGEPGLMSRIWHTRALNPIEAVREIRRWPNIMNPMIRAFAETATSTDLLTGRPMEREGMIRDILTGEYSRVTPQGVERTGKSGGLKMFLARLAQQTPPARFAMDIGSGFRPRYGDVFTKAIPGSKTRGSLQKTLMQYSGFPFTDIDLERLAESLTEKRKRQTTQHWKRKMLEDPERLRKAAMSLM